MVDIIFCKATKNFSKLRNSYLNKNDLKLLPTTNHPLCFNTTENNVQCFKFTLFRDANTFANENTTIKIIYLSRYTEKY